LGSISQKGPHALHADHADGIRAGHCLARSNRVAVGTKEDPAEVEDDLGHGWFASSLCVSIGLAGTAIGYYLMLQNGNAAGEPSEVIRQAFANTSIAIVNTVVGALCGILLEIQSHFIGHAVRKALRRSAKGAHKDGAL
jgi:hypothetical protein